MIYFYSFLICGIICAIGQIILENTKLTPGHLNTIFVIIGVILGFLGIYDNLITLSGTGATLPITNFGYVLFSGAYEGFKTSGILGLLKGILSSSSIVLCTTIISSFIVTLIFKPKH
ncbi:MAG: SpoVA/SpoVAEb family sporulation membrane protein [Bacilli bacterium]